jgi:8-amino-7-oxononanoate synthase
MSGREGVSSSEVFDLGPELKSLEEKNLLRVLRVMGSAPGARAELEGKSVLNFASNNYLGLAGHPSVVAAAREASEAWGAGATASRLLGGTLAVHERLEKALAGFKKTEACAVFPSGWHANLGALPALMGPGDTVVLDRLAHASLVDGARLSRADLLVFKHNDVEDLERVLRRAPVTGRRWIVTESVFSMDGDVAPLCEMVFVAERYNARLYVDEAHGTGVFGPGGSGVVNGLGLEKKVAVCMGTLSKALGAQGGFVCGSEDLIRWIHNKARSFIYSTALAPAAAGAALAAVGMLPTEGEERRKRVLSLSARLRDGLEEIRRAGAGGTVSAAAPARAIRSPYTPYERGPIVPFLVGGEEDALALSRRLWDAGVFAPAVRPPTVPKGTARLRFSVTADHTPADIDRVLAALAR